MDKTIRKFRFLIAQHDIPFNPTCVHVWIPELLEVLNTCNCRKLPPLHVNSNTHRDIFLCLPALKILKDTLKILTCWNLLLRRTHYCLQLNVDVRRFCFTKINLEWLFFHQDISSRTAHPPTQTIFLSLNQWINRSMQEEDPVPSVIVLTLLNITSDSIVNHLWLIWDSVVNQSPNFLNILAVKAKEKPNS